MTTIDERWRYEKQAYSNYPCYSIQTRDMSHKKTFIGEIGGGMHTAEEVEENAKLVSLTPDMYRVLKAISQSDYLRKEVAAIGFDVTALLNGEDYEL